MAQISFNSTPLSSPQSHEGMCPQESVYCENKCGARMMRRLLAQHATSECPKRTQPCTYCTKEFVFDTIQVRPFLSCELWGRRYGVSLFTAVSASVVPESPIPVPKAACALPQPVWRGHCGSGGPAKSSEGQL